jgi:hypothetical protein
MYINYQNLIRRSLFMSLDFKIHFGYIPVFKIHILKLIYSIKLRCKYGYVS